MKSEHRKKYLKERRAKVCDACGGEREIGGFCKSCWNKREKRRKKREQDKAAKGECRTCKNKVSGKVHCNVCLNKRRLERARREEERKAQGVCILCGKAKAGSSKKCSRCYAKDIASFHFGSTNRAEELLCLLKCQKDICPYTGINLVIGDNASLDHKIPKSKGGSNDLENLQWLYSGDFDVNKMKWDMTDEEFVKAINVIFKKVGSNGM